jgi:hypothetical protein
LGLLLLLLRFPWAVRWIIVHNACSLSVLQNNAKFTVFLQFTQDSRSPDWGSQASAVLLLWKDRGD